MVLSSVYFRERLAPVALSLLTLSGCGRDPRNSLPFESDAAERGSNASPCSAPLLACDDACVDTEQDPDHCGGCGVDCGESSYCSAGECLNACPAPLLMCDGACVDTEQDPDHCGGCGVDCGGLSYCSAGECLDACPPPLVGCEGSCIDPRESAPFCGATNDCQGQNAGVECAETESCEAGVCVPLPLDFVTVWQTDQPGDSNYHQITLPLVENGSYDFTVDWGDGSSSHISSFDSPETTHTYAEMGQYRLTISGEIEGWSFYNFWREEPLEEWGYRNNPFSDTSLGYEWDYFPTIGHDVPGWVYESDARKLLEIEQFGSLSLGATEGQFLGALHLTITAADAPDLSHTPHLVGTFAGCRALETAPSLQNWDLSRVTSTAFMFSNADLFNEDISAWDVGSVTNMHAMFYGATQFNQDIGDWDTSRVNDMSQMFFGQEEWEVVFRGFCQFNQDVGDWNTSNVMNMRYMFTGCVHFNQDIGDWNTSSVTDMGGLFWGATRFNQDIANWNTSNVRDMSFMFSGASSFNQPLSDWDTSNVRDMSFMFGGAVSFNQDLLGWDTSSVTDMRDMFGRHWPYPAVETEHPVAFNGDVSTWDTSSVTDMSHMFDGAESFNRDIGNWNVENVETMSKMFRGGGLSTTHYDATLIGWSTQSVQHGVSFNAESSTYSAAASAARDTLIAAGWTITDGGLAP